MPWQTMLRRVVLLALLYCACLVFNYALFYLGADQNFVYAAF